MSDRTITIPGRIDICDFASLFRFYEEADVRIRTKSDLLWQICKDFASLLQKNGRARSFTDIGSAIQYMDSRGIHVVSNERIRRQVSLAMQDEHLELDAFSPSKKDWTTKHVGANTPAKERENIQRDYEMYCIVYPGTTMEEFMRRRNEQQPAQEAEHAAVNEQAFIAKEEEKRRALKEGLRAGLGFVPAAGEGE